MFLGIAFSKFQFFKNSGVRKKIQAAEILFVKLRSEYGERNKGLDFSNLKYQSLRTLKIWYSSLILKLKEANTCEFFLRVKFVGGWNALIILD